MPGFEGAYALEERLSSRHEAGGEELRQDCVVEDRSTWECGQEGLDLGGEEELVAVDDVVERLDSQPVPREHQLAPGPIPEGEREHPA